MILEVRELMKEFGGLRAVSDFSLEVKSNELVGLIGPNGAGKTTVFNLLTGVYKADAGYIKLMGEDITGEKPYKITENGMARTFQNIRLFRDMTVLDNVLVSMHFNMSYGLFGSIFKTKLFHKEEICAKKKAEELLDRFNLVDKQSFLAKNLPYGEQRRLEIVRALATNPEILLLDEPAAGMNPQETLKLMSLIKKLQEDFNLAILLIEHDMKFVMNLCEKIVVLDYGRMIAKGDPDAVKNNPKVIEAYLGTVEE